MESSTSTWEGRCSTQGELGLDLGEKCSIQGKLGLDLGGRCSTQGELSLNLGREEGALPRESSASTWEESARPRESSTWEESGDKVGVYQRLVENLQGMAGQNLGLVGHDLSFPKVSKPKVPLRWLDFTFYTWVTHVMCSLEMLPPALPRAWRKLCSLSAICGAMLEIRPTNIGLIVLVLSCDTRGTELRLIRKICGLP
ncbi:hypothetical protein FNV43_RR27290 [Rhamnella rubrinervis]|uniref:Uncharacterized protein n=1 Tax=Rhamnella rubrinervis TaxID=2594499 RepID=A0A8K0GSE2_9ROSA|nr:hypothetical protein FNV43_RR27290 [Rhamnella rubrinervis]